MEILLLIVIALLLLLNLWLSARPKSLDASLKDDFARNREESSRNAKETREELSRLFKDVFSPQLASLSKVMEEKLEKMRETIESKLLSMQTDNNLKLEKMRETVDEKLHKTLEQRLGESFKLVSERLELVHKGLGEMQSLATGVGDLKKVLSNVKTRGILGEIQLGNILEQIMSPAQYDKNVCTKHGSRDNVEFAIKLPGKSTTDEVVYLPVDSKFPIESYYSLLSAYDQGDASLVEEAGKQIEAAIKKSARDIRDKYIDPPHTTDFGILFLPTEGLYAEVARRPSLLEALQRDMNIIITGPTTLAALLNSLQMGFKTLAIEKRSSEVWRVLSAVKTEFSKFGDVLQKAQDKLDQASHEIGNLVGTRTKQIQRKLKDLQEIPEAQAAILITEESSDNDTDQGQNS
ncbi:MAG: DNA recombination protein RmuC [Candidatus Margulisiibacteriota bacterium]|jgi:DNA recombination protein RmuC